MYPYSVWDQLCSRWLASGARSEAGLPIQVQGVICTGWSIRLAGAAVAFLVVGAGACSGYCTDCGNLNLTRIPRVLATQWRCPRRRVKRVEKKWAYLCTTHQYDSSSASVVVSQEMLAACWELPCFDGDFLHGETALEK